MAIVLVVNCTLLHRWVTEGMDGGGPVSGGEDGLGAVLGTYQPLPVQQATSLIELHIEHSARAPHAFVVSQHITAPPLIQLVASERAGRSYCYTDRLSKLFVANQSIEF